jgi:hypothetical protein
MPVDEKNGARVNGISSCANIGTFPDRILRIESRRGKLSANENSFAQRLQPAGLPDGLFSNQKSQIWVNFGGPLNGKCWCIL